MKNRFSNSMERGYSVIELLTVLAIVAAIVLVTVPMIHNMTNSWRVQSAASQLRIRLMYARNAAVTQKICYRMVLRSQSQSPPNTYQLERSTATDPYTCTTVTSWERVGGMDYKLPTGVKILTSVGPFVYHSGGQCVPSGTITIEGANGQQYQVIIRSTGAVDPPKKL